MLVSDLIAPLTIQEGTKYFSQNTAFKILVSKVMSTLVYGKKIIGVQIIC